MPWAVMILTVTLTSHKDLLTRWGVTTESPSRHIYGHRAAVAGRTWRYPEVSANQFSVSRWVMQACTILYWGKWWSWVGAQAVSARMLI